MPALAGKRICVTGGAGFLGSHLVQALAGCGPAEVFVPRSRHYDLTNSEGIKRLFRDTRPEVIFHLATPRTHQPGTLLHASAMMGLQLIEMARQFGVQKMILAGSVTMYAAGMPAPLREKSLWDGPPLSIDGIAKRVMLEQARANRTQHSMDTICLVPAALYGPGQPRDGVLTQWIGCLIEAVESRAPHVTLSGEPEQLREFLYVEDAAAGFVQAAEQYSSAEPCNLGSGSETTLRCLGEQLAELCGYQGHIVWDRTEAPTVAQRKLDPTRAAGAFHFRAPTELPEGLQRTVDWVRENRQ